MNARCKVSRRHSLGFFVLLMCSLLILLIPLWQRTPTVFLSPMPSDSLFRQTSSPDIIRSPGVSPGTPLSGEVNATNTYWAETYTITTPGLYQFNYSVNCIDNPYSLAALLLAFSDSMYSYCAPLDDNETVSAPFWWYTVHISTGNSYEVTHYFVFPNPGEISVSTEIFSIYIDSSVEFRIDVELSLVTASSAASSLGIGEHQLTWNTPLEARLYTFEVTDEAFYNVTIEYEVPYNTGSPSYYSFFEAFRLYDVEHGMYVPWDYFSLADNIPSGSGVITGYQTHIIPLAPHSYYWLTQVRDFTEWGGGYIDLNVTIEKITAQIVSIGSPASYTFDTSSASGLAGYAFLEMDDTSVYSLDIMRNQGYNWSVTSKIGEMSTGVEYDHLQIGSTTYTDVYALRDLIAHRQTTGSISGASGGGSLYTYMYGRKLFSEDGTPTTANFWYGYNFHLTGRIPVILSASPNTDYSTTFSVSLTLTGTTIPLLTTTTTAKETDGSQVRTPSDVVPIDTTIGPFFYYYRVSVQSGYRYLVTAEATTYTTTGYSGVTILPPSNQENWFYYTPLDKPMPLSGDITINGKAGREFVSTTNGEVLIVVLGTIATGYGDTEELTVDLSVTEPTPYIVDTIQTVTPNSLATYSFLVEAGNAYLVTIGLSSPESDLVVGTVFDQLGNTPFEISSQELWVTSTTTMPFVSGSISSTSTTGFVDYTGGFLAKETAIVTIAISGCGEPITFLVQTWLPFGAAHQQGFTLGHLLVVAITIPLTFTITYLVLRRRRRSE